MSDIHFNPLPKCIYNKMYLLKWGEVYHFRSKIIKLENVRQSG